MFTNYKVKFSKPQTEKEKTISHIYHVVLLYHTIILHKQDLRVLGGADKSLAQSGRKQTTVTKLGIYSAYSPRSLLL